MSSGPAAPRRTSGRWAPSSRPSRAGSRAALCAGFAVLCLSACAGASGATGSAATPVPTSAPPTTAVASPPPVVPAGQVPAPLTGVPVDPARAALPAVAVSVLVESGGAAPKGLDAADLVYVDYVEPGNIRLISMFQSQDATEVGPLGWARPEDAKALSVFGPVLAHDGGPKGFIAQLPRLDVAGFSNADRPDLFRAVPGSTDYVSTSVIRAASTGLSAPPAAFTVQAGSPVARQGVAPATTVTVTVPSQATLTWAYDPDGHVWRATLAGAPVTAANLVVVTMPYTTLTLHSPKRYLPSPTFTGTGAVRVLSQGSTAVGTWSKLATKQLLQIADQAGFPFELTPGNTWVLLVPPTGQAVVG